ncbi:MAG: hypothetical protein LBC82_03905 [Oscillospiraceae bacterium]|jgi:hypothetical protein|nr:hypothetical protein [Oscillospiraceae bacterium]
MYEVTIGKYVNIAKDLFMYGIARIVVGIILPSLSDIIEKILMTLIVIPLFLISQIMTAVDIFTGVQPLSIVTAADPLFTSEPARINGMSAPLLPCPAVGADSEAERLWFDSWRMYINSNSTIVLHPNLNINSPDRYTPHVRAFFEENEIPFGSDRMYKLLADAIVTRSKVGEGLTPADIAAVDLPPASEYQIKRRYLASDDENELLRPAHSYSEENYVVLETYSINIQYLDELLNTDMFSSHGLDVSEEILTDDESESNIRTLDSIAQEEYERLCRLLFLDAYNRGFLNQNYFEERLNYLRNNPNAENYAELKRLTDPTNVMDLETVEHVLEVHSIVSFDGKRTFYPNEFNRRDIHISSMFAEDYETDLFNPHLNGNRYMVEWYFDHNSHGSSRFISDGTDNDNTEGSGIPDTGIGNVTEIPESISKVFSDFTDVIHSADEVQLAEIIQLLNVLYINFNDFLKYGPYLGTPFEEYLGILRLYISTDEVYDAIESLQNNYGLNLGSDVAQALDYLADGELIAAPPGAYMVRLRASLSALNQELDNNSDDGRKEQIENALLYLEINEDIIRSGDYLKDSDLSNEIIRLREIFSDLSEYYTVAEERAAARNALAALGVNLGDLLYSALPEDSPEARFTEAFDAMKKELTELEANPDDALSVLRLDLLENNLHDLGIDMRLVRDFDGDLTAVLEAMKSHYIRQNITEQMKFRFSLLIRRIDEDDLLTLTGITAMNEDDGMLTEEQLQLARYFMPGNFADDFFISYGSSINDILYYLSYGMSGFEDDYTDEGESIEFATSLSELINREDDAFSDEEFDNNMVLMAFYPANLLWVDFLQNNVDIIANPDLPYNDPMRYHLGVNIALQMKNYASLENLQVFGSDSMYRYLAEAIHEGILDVRDLSIYSAKMDYYDAEDQIAAQNHPTVTKTMSLLEYFLSNKTVTAVFWGITLICIVLCILFSIYEVLRSMGDFELQKPVSKVLKLVGKSMLTFLIIPFFVLASVSLSSVVLRQTSNALFGSDGRDVNFTGAVFYSAVTPEAVMLPGERKVLKDYVLNTEGNYLIGKGVSISIERMNRTGMTLERKTEMNEILKEQYLYGEKGRFSDLGAAYTNLQRDFDFIKLVSHGNLLIVALTAWFMVAMMVLVMFVFIRRIFDLIMLYIVSPFFTATIPLDDGKAFKEWREKFIGTLIMGFGSLITFKILILLLPVILDPGFKMHNNNVADYLLKLLLCLGGIYAVYKSHSLVSSLVNSDAGEGEKGTAGWVMATVGGGAAMAVDVAKDTTKAALSATAMMAGAPGSEKMLTAAIDTVGSKVSNKLENLGKDNGGGNIMGDIADGVVGVAKGIKGMASMGADVGDMGGIGKAFSGGGIGGGDTKNPAENKGNITESGDM